MSVRANNARVIGVALSVLEVIDPTDGSEPTTLELQATRAAAHEWFAGHDLTAEQSRAVDGLLRCLGDAIAGDTTAARTTYATALVALVEPLAPIARREGAATEQGFAEVAAYLRAKRAELAGE